MLSLLLSFRNKAIFLMVFGSTLISFTGLIIRNMESAGALEINLIRGISLSITVFLILLFKYKLSAVSKIIAVGKPGLAAGFALATAGICLLQAITNTTVAATLFICSSVPFLTAILALFLLKETIAKFTLAAMCCAAVGVGIMLLGNDGTKSSYGALMAFFTAMSFSVYAVIVRKHRSIEMLPALAISGILISLFCLLLLKNTLTFTWMDMFRCMLLGCFVSLIPNMLFLYSTRYLLAGELTFFMLFEFALGPFWVWIFINEVPSIWTMAGGFIVMTSVVIFILKEIKSKRFT